MHGKLNKASLCLSLSLSLSLSHTHTHPIIRTHTLLLALFSILFLYHTHSLAHINNDTTYCLSFVSQRKGGYFTDFRRRRQFKAEQKLELLNFHIFYGKKFPIKIMGRRSI